MTNAEITFLLGTAIQLIKDIERISFLGDAGTCMKINHMAKDWLKCGENMLDEKEEVQNHA